MTYLYILAGIWTLLAISWTSAWLGSSDKDNDPSRLERFIRSKEGLVAAYKHESTLLSEPPDTDFPQIG